jgi:hypothetical protein
VGIRRPVVLHESLDRERMSQVLGT